jgi:hypothetical protein
MLIGRTMVHLVSFVGIVELQLKKTIGMIAFVNTMKTILIARGVSNEHQDMFHLSQHTTHTGGSICWPSMSFMWIAPGGVRMNRRIKRNRAIPIHITMPPALLDDIDAQLSHKMSRSNWIRGACDLKLGKDVTEVQDLTDIQLVNVLRNRCNYEGPGEAILKSLLEILSESS